MRCAVPGFGEGAVTRQLRRFFFVRLLLLVERHQTYVGRTLASEHGPRHEVLAQFALPLRKGVRALPVERELVVLGVMHGLAGIAEAVRDRRAVRLLMLGKLRQCTPTLGRSLRKTLGCRIAGILEGTFRAFDPSSIYFYRMHDPTQHLTFSREIRCSRRVKKTYLASDDQNVQVAQYA